MFKTQTVDPYPVRITKTLLKKWQGEIRVWDSPQSAIEGGKVLDIIVKPTQARVLEEQLDMFGSIPQRARIRYSRNKEGWVIYDMIAKPKSAQD
ncbi:MAG: hypothetical protein IIC87_05710 [Chloroflexi bacterium]|nr:hypothetical protein [Chloroflexota bacterium]